MHFPPYHKRKSWQYIFIGVFIGGVLSYCILIFMHGKMYEQLLSDHLQLQTQFTELQNQNKALLQDKKDLNEKSKQSLTVHTINVKFTNTKELRLDRLITHQFEEMIKQEINHIIGQDIEIVAESEQLLISTIENKVFSIDNFTYHFEVTKLFISQKITLTLKVKISNLT